MSGYCTIYKHGVNQSFSFRKQLSTSNTEEILRKMVMILGLCAVTLLSVVSGIPVEDVPNQCPPVAGSYPVFYGHPDDCQYYFMCDNGVPLLKQCAEGARWSDVFRTCVGYNTHFDTCTRDNAQRECSRGATGFIPHPTACQRYYNCSKTQPPPMFSYLGLYEDECPYPQVFDVVLKECKSYTEAYCGPYRSPALDPCDYLKNRCGSGHCEPCSSRMPSCVGLSDGEHEHPLRLWSPYYIKCKDQRNVGPGHYYCGNHALTGHVALFSPVKKACVSLWEIPREHSGLAPSCDGKAPGQSYRSDERPDVYYSCPGAQVSYCGVGNVFNESSQQCESSN